MRYLHVKKLRDQAMKLREIHLEYFEATMIAPVKRLKQEEQPDIPVSDYLLACEETYQLLKDGRDFMLMREFLSGDEMHVHAVFWYGHPDRCLVLVLNRLSGTIFGHHFLDLPDTRSGHACGVPNPKPPQHLMGKEEKELPEN
ncbi:MAG TPA: hypothetical protein VGH19_07460 [Verrucomicrobiae bacterium]